MKHTIFRTALVAATTLATGAIAIAPASAQTTTASVRGTVRDAAGAVVSGATVVAVSSGTNQTYRATTDASGRYTLNGIRAGAYAVTITGPSGEVFTRDVTVGIAQSASLDATLGAAAPATGDTAAAPDSGDGGSDGEIVVTGTRLAETRTSEIATNVSQQQLRTLPQTDRNFLSFAALAPGVRYNDSETDKGFQAGASTASQVNVFIDGVSLKNKLREGGVAGQQNSRGNPFGQLAVQEFRVLTQNYKAEYEQAGSAIITAVTKSGTNEFHGEVFGQYTDRSLTERSFLDRRNDRDKPAFERKQYGISLGGPIIKDKLFFFGAYEGNDQDRAFIVDSTGSAANIAAFQAATGRTLADFEGNYVSPFRGDFYFGKLTFTPDDAQTFDLSYSRREETDIQGFGGNTSYEFAENKLNTVDTYLLKWTYRGDSFINEVNLNYLNYVFNPTSLNPGSPSFNYDSVILFGGRDSTRREVQQGYTIRDDFTYTALEGHAIKAGARVEITDIEFSNLAFLQPGYIFRVDAVNNTDFTFPAEARLGLGNGTVRGSNTQLGFYLQDDWDVTDRLQLNVGLRWDYETNGNNNNFVTSPAAAAALRALPATSYFDPENYISTRNNRKAFAGAFAPRFGFSYDVKDDGTTVFFGGFGRYYDRNNFNNTVDEQSRTINPIGVFRFSRDGAPRNGLPTVAWNPNYLTREGLLALRATSTSGLPELFAVKNDTKPPVNDQVSLGIRQQVGPLQVAVTGSYQRGRNGYTNLFATRRNGGTGPCCDTSPLTPFGFSNALIGYDGLDTRYKALYVTVDKPYSRTSGYGVNIAYTLSKGEQNGGDLFSLDEVTPDDYGWRPRNGDERHRLVFSGIVDLPLGFQFSTLSTFGSGQAFRVTDVTLGSDPGQRKFTASYPDKNCIGGVFAYCEVNLTLANKLKILGGETEIAIDVLNAFNNNNFSGFDDNFNNQIDPATGQARDPLEAARIGRDLLTLPRRIQFRVGYRF
ncbi:TonB-dependent receptor [Sphingomonas sp. CFBP 13720]|uniref:TonB-dependent receptor n=1 Tax=Sphingomonas sp. CFBP 13720 TaxID=2775302 RepID=UPI00178738B7|nr:carboxypeptidase regulatory-like domain-containing protein [Sphingomonas sp. CFBP 13720]MBD8679456.1 TonB-dependent receptor [Sphingomonas sp. CFBP 13720]